MSIDFLISVLQDIENPKKVNRNKAAIIVLEQPYLIEYLVDLTFKVDDKISIKAAWILEWICTHYDIIYLSPYMDKFTKGLPDLTIDGALRCCAKICENLAFIYTSKEDTIAKQWITNVHIDAIIETGFDWLITDQKIAVKAYTMTTLFLFGQYRDWVHPELEHVIATSVIHESKGCKARGKKILDLIAKNKKV
ncbi:hypothetical protein [Tenacibaculum agarivorans]|uniref:hypothetical protein n=1 Tax=Tenacibaculum agarivorans TaxID=1908389 RepID=UPI00094B814B|nr:hypothetical protein [Tenacibaculum agarivorans]